LDGSAWAFESACLAGSVNTQDFYNVEYVKMIISIIVKTRATKENIEEIGDGKYKVSVSAEPKENKANKRIIGLLSKYFDVPKSSVTIISGKKSNIKIVEIYD
jgi:uncharacterized protein (TIGR00251 family)